MFTKLLEKIDLFGFPINLTYRKKQTHKTNIGGFLTLGIATIYVIAFYFFGREVIIKKNPITIYNQEFEESPGNFKVKPNTFPFAFGLQDGSTWEQFIDESIYQVSAQSYERHKILNEQTGKYELVEKTYEVKIGPCNVAEDLSDIPDAIKYFQRLDVSQMYCLKKNQDHIPEIEGQWDSQTYKSLTIAFSGCKNTTTYNKCKSQEQIDKKIKAGFFSMNYVDLTVNPRDPNHAYNYFGKDSYTYTSNQLTKNIDFFLKHVEMSSDEGWLFEDVHNQNGVAFGEMRDMIDMRKNDVFCFFTLKLQSKKDVYSRQYKKVQNVMAEVEGFLKVLFLICLIITIPITKLNFYISLLNQLFVFTNNELEGDFNDLDEDEIKDDKNYLNNKKLSQRQIQMRQKTITLKQEENRKNSALATVLKQQTNLGQKRLSKYQSEIINVISQKKDSQKQITEQDYKIKSGGLNMNLSEQIRYYMCPKKSHRQKMKKINQTIDQIKSNLDTVYILEKLQELDKIKLLLLTPNQLSLFDLLSKPIINLDEEDNKLQLPRKSDYISLLTQKKSHIQKIKDAFLAYNNIDLQKADKFDKKLIELLDDNIRQIFQKASQQSSEQFEQKVKQKIQNSNNNEDVLIEQNDDEQQQELESADIPVVAQEDKSQFEIIKFVKGKNVIK